jgi:multiple sugar transport system substrate-binding protein
MTHSTEPISVLAWDHPRCTGPLAAAAAAWERLPGGCPVIVLRRDGHAFAGQPLAATTAADLVVIDHPFSGAGLTDGTLVPVETLLAPATRAALAGDSAGPSHESYLWRGHQMALAADAACHAAAWRPDLLPEPPSTWDEVLALSRREPGRVGLALVGHGAICALLTLCTSAGAGPRHDAEPFVDREAGLWALRWLADLVALVPPDRIDRPVDELLAAMHDGDEIVYTPMAFPYTTHAIPRAPGGPALRYGPVPTVEPAAPPTGALLGGTGLAVSARSERPEAAAAFAAWYASAEIQSGLVLEHGGQPASRAAWTSATANARTNDFFASILPGLETAYVRPREPWWPSAQRDADDLLYRTLLAREPVEQILERLERLFDAARAD